MVSTRGPRSRYFEKGEKVLCYEPDPSKAKVLYDSKILGTYETKDKRGRKSIQYKIHFQGWSSSWDRKVSADFVLKDTEENRQLQRDLAEKAQLQLGAYLYRKEHSKNKKRSRKSAAINSEDSADASTSPTKLRPRGLSEDNFSSSGSTFEKNENCSMKDDCETDSCCSSVESFHDEDRVMLRISERLRQYLEYDHDMIVKYGKQHALPSRIPIVAILENFVKQTALKMVFTNNQTEGGTTRRRTAQQRTADKKEKDVDKIINTITLLKEVADGIRIYFDFTITDYLLYKEEEDYALSYLSEENLKTFTYVATPAFSMEWFNTKTDTAETNATATNTIAADVVIETTTPTATTGITPIANLTETPSSIPASSTANNANTITTTVSQEDQPQRRKLRSHRSDDCDLTLENCLSSIASTSSGASTPLHSNIPVSHLNYLKSLPPISPQIRDFLQNVLSWRLLPTNAVPAPAMIFGAPHLARLLVKLPEFLNASSMTDEKLKVLLQHLDTFTNYLESHKEWFNEDNYVRGNIGRKTTTTISTDSTKTEDTETTANTIIPAQETTTEEQPLEENKITTPTSLVTTSTMATTVESVAS
ncbi:protein male-specific lethal-3 [Lucilia sericata]|uniref:protein male-specific lethal-3 n=1 Tax=Lucilia sericata TaxID=13632 RepID=UPI0018A87396|nr:protein male-specific lethal-3 [Lucilia sericata]